MKKLYFLMILWLFNACQQEKPSQIPKESESEKIFKAAKVLSDETVLQKLLQKENLQPYDIYKKCVENKLDFATMCRFVRAVYAKPNEDFHKKHELEWHLSRLPLLEFAQMLYYYKEPHHKTFMDVGSGNGDKLYTALCMGFTKAYGVEYEKKLNDVAIVALKDMIEKGIIESKEGDATKLSDEYYRQADFLYMYCPLVLNKPEQAKLLYRLLKNMRDNTIIYEAGYMYSQEFNQLNPMPISDGYRGFLAIKKEQGKYYYRIFVKSWEEFSFK